MLDENLIVELVRRRVVTDRFRRLPPDKKQLIYETTVRLFGEYGYDGLPVDRLCREAGISKGSFFQYFESKSHLLEFSILVFDDYLEKWVAEVRRAETSVLVRDRLRYLYDALVVNSKLFAPEKRFYMFVTNALHHAGIEIQGFDIGRHINAYIVEIVTRGNATGEIRGDFDVALTGHLVSAIMEALLQQQFTGRRLPRKETGDYLVSFLMDGVKA